MSEDISSTTDVCALPLARRFAAMLDRDPHSLREGDPLPRGWHAMLFNTPTPQSQLRVDGAAYLGVTLPDIGLPRLMLGGRQNRFDGDVPIGAHVRRETRRGHVTLKQGSSGRFALVEVEHRIFVEGKDRPAVTEQQTYVLRPASEATSTNAPSAAEPGARTHDRPPVPTVSRILVPDEPLLFRYSAITDNPHRIHYDQAYALEQESYPALVVNGSIPAMFLLELFRTVVGHEPATFSSRNLAPMFCGRPLHLHILQEEQGWRLWAENEQRRTTLDATAA